MERRMTEKGNGTGVWSRLPMGAAAGALALLASAGSAFAADAPVLDSGNTAWMLTSTALVLFMTIPGLALFYGGMVRKKNVVTISAQTFALIGLISILWMVTGYPTRKSVGLV